MGRTELKRVTLLKSNLFNIRALCFDDLKTCQILPSNKVQIDILSGVILQVHILYKICL